MPSAARPKDMQWRKIRDAQAFLGPQPQMGQRELQDFARRVVRSRWFGSRWSGESPGQAPLERPKVTVSVKGTPQGCYCDAEVRLDEQHGRTAMWNTGPDRADRLNALHMVAHLLTDDLDEPLHGPKFAHTFVLAVGRFIGKDAEKDLRAAFKSYRVKLYTWSLEHREKAKERAAERKFRGAGERLKELAASLEAEDW